MGIFISSTRITTFFSLHANYISIFVPYLSSMRHITYSYIRSTPTRYYFISVGKRRIIKVVDFVPTANRRIYNMGFGDLKTDGSINDSARSDNGFIIKRIN